MDGYSHIFKYKEDKERDKRLAELGYITIRIEESEVVNDLENVVRVLECYLPKK